MSRGRRTGPLGGKKLEAVIRLLGPEAVLAGEGGARPVARPGSSAEVAALIRLARAERFALHVGREAGSAGSGLGLSLERFDRISSIDEQSMLVSAGGGVVGERLEEAVQAAGYRPIRDVPSEIRLGAHLAGSPAPPTALAGGVAELCVGLDAVLADGTMINSRVTPRSATGPDLKHMLLGTRGALGVILGATLRLEPLGLARAELAWTFGEASAAEAAASTLVAQGCVWPGMAQTLSDDGEFVLAAAISGHGEVVEAAVAACRNRLEDGPGRELPARRTREVHSEIAARERDAGPGPAPAELAQAFGRLKRELDPAGVLNPGAVQ